MNDMTPINDDTPKQECVHAAFESNVKVFRLTNSETGKVEAFSAAVRITCTDCGAQFQFQGIPPGLTPEHPTVSIDCLEANLPIVPAGSAPTHLDNLVVQVKKPPIILN